MLNLSGRPVLVVGGGMVATRRVGVLLAQDARVTVIAPQVSEELAQHADSGQIVWEQRGFEPGDVAGNVLVLALTDNPAVQEAVRRACEIASTLCLVGGHPRSSTLWFMAHRLLDGLTVAVSAGGNPRRAQETVENLARHIKASKSSTR
ncbi:MULTISPECIES: bifunctional precorrin-2 dehydrogenase/sirohydrochlorin ferrochelatase [unclassified Rothia (in: high G+C Gram-positive bacteria)]|uniref:precorrin-2 dehydrogenase/sirohydrochlorin ferrochelatase family protein n=1 Tax=unclassified Rothia (in: high G+C Gram-positive bacteria) TaxID=2689056 RepID=UPI00195AE0C4|nr:MULTISPECIES: bifunctional precorrin-2 dehydrogenase/sirohydrochlorin ferrochelatase [unclassified Rothia (in: high G+C Gram-positive bacteria)]MBM7050426.1 bifunctional precorrin-2 dehydrogenase/sirohydrochlorin ferrochelatase [Rothia sp. ZJ1223]QRZ62411.1 bifunctional precorrin-2 dehydrogenase/sirohydrochlorin ferrochelatase [Rothia sp. ZJ932]